MSEGGRTDPQPGIMDFAGLGLLGAVCLLAAMAAGWAVDTVLNTLPVFLMVGLVAGIALAVLAVRAQLRRR